MVILRHYWRYIAILCAIVVSICIIYTRDALSPPHLLWSLFSGYYRYDPRVQTPPRGLFQERPESSLVYFFDATLKRCNGIYAPLSSIKVIRYEVEEVEYFGKTDYHAWADIRTRVYFADGTSTRAIFRFEAGHNEWDPFLLFFEGSAIRVGSWMSIGSFLRDPDLPPPGWLRYQEDERYTPCNPGPPYQVEESQ